MTSVHEKAVMSSKRWELELPGVYLHVDPDVPSWLLYLQNDSGEWERYTEEGYANLKMCAAPLERTIRTNIVHYLNGLPDTKAKVWNQDGRQKGNPDIVCCQNGKLFLFEVKRPEMGRTTSLQEATHAQWRKSGAQVHIVHSIEEVALIMSQ